MITITVPDNASLEDVIKVFTLEVLRLEPGQEKAAKQIGIDRHTLADWLHDWGIILACVQNSPEAIPARKPQKPRAARVIPPSAAPSPPGVKPAGLQSIADEAAAIRAAHQRRRPPRRSALITNSNPRRSGVSAERRKLPASRWRRSA